MSISIWLFFLLFVFAMVALDLGVFHRRPEAPSVRDALTWTLIWVSMALLFNVIVYVLYENNFGWASLATEHLTGKEAATQYLLGYVLEKSLSVDNIFVIAMIFAYFRVPLALQHRVLFWGILGAVALRGVMIALGVALINRFDWITYIFGALLIYTAARMLLLREETVDPSENTLVRLAQRWVPVTATYHGSHFFVRDGGRRIATPLFLALVLVETSDVMFAVDSIPAVFAVTRDPFIVFTSNIFAILGLRSLYFVLAGYMARFRYLKSALVFVLAYVGVKMLLSNHYHIPGEVSLGVILGILSVGIIASIRGGARDPHPLKSPLD
ncbi:TerC family protein [Elongatibacter sediminis]|uniref:TerC family protein n=1 Tax=Elongatibacter sediminis TaxID=3119006 RepID=A0AAW9R718_9GAMM